MLDGSHDGQVFLTMSLGSLAYLRIGEPSDFNCNLEQHMAISCVLFFQVIPPKEWYASQHYDMEKIGSMVIDSPIAQLVTGRQGMI